MIKNCKILITGGLGFIGSHLISSLYKENKVYVLDKADSRESSLNLMGLSSHNNITIIKADLYNTLAELNELPDNFEYIVHAAGILGVKNVIDNPYETIIANGLGAINIAEFCRKQKNLKKVLFFSTSEVYGVEANQSGEDSPLILPSDGVRWCYATSKFYGEYIFRSAHKKFGLPFSIVRPFNIYGPFRTGSNAVSSIINNSLKNNVINITGDGLQTRCWCYISDFIAGITEILIQPNAVGQVFNIGNDNEAITIIDLAKKIVKLTGSISEINVGSEHIEDVNNRKPNIEKAKNLLQYNPVVTLDEGLNNTVNWFKNI